MIVVVFRSRLTPDAGADYGRMAEEMTATAKGMPGFVDVKSFTAEDGERLTLVWWKDRETLAGAIIRGIRSRRRRGVRSGTSTTRLKLPR